VTAATPLTGPLAARVYSSTNQSIPNNASTVLTFNFERRDDGELHNTITNSSRLVAQASGWYLISFAGAFDFNPSGFRAFNFVANGSAAIAASTKQPITTTGGLTGDTVKALYYLNAGDYVEVTAYQNSGGSLSVLALGNYSPEFSMARIA